MTINLSDLNGQLMQWLGMLDEQMDTSKLKDTVKTCCGKTYENRETAIGALADLTDVLSAHGFSLDDSELQIQIAKKIDELSIAHVGAAAAVHTVEKKQESKVDEKAPVAPAQALPSDPKERKIALIKREQHEVAEELHEAEGLAADDDEVRALRRAHFGNYSEALIQLLAKVESATDGVLPSAEPIEQKALLVAEAPKAAPVVEEKKAAVKESAAATPTKEIDPELAVEMAEKEREIDSLLAEITGLEKDGEKGLLKQLRETVERKVEELAHFREALS